MLSTIECDSTSSDETAVIGDQQTQKRITRVLLNPSSWAVVGWLAVLPIAFTLPGAVGLNPFHFRGAMVPLEMGFVGLAAVALLFWWKRMELVSGIAAGAFAGWIAVTLRSALNGTPYGFGGLQGDATRLAAMATRYTVVSHSSDGIVAAVPSEYPPLFPWLVGRGSALLGLPAWSVLADAEVITCSLAFVASFLLWRRLVPSAVALMVTIAAVAVFSRPDKAYEVLALMVFTPWVLATFARPARGGLHWLPAGLIGGLMILLYQAYLIYGAAGLAALMAMTWWQSAERRGYLRHLAGTLLVILAVSSWYWIPIGIWNFSHGTEMTQDLWQGQSLLSSPFPFLALTPLGLLQLVGLIGLVWNHKRLWWARPILLLVASAYLYRVLFLARFIATGHTALMHYTAILVAVTLSTAGILTVLDATPVLLRRLEVVAPRGLPPLAGSIFTVLVVMYLWTSWMPGAPANSGVAVSYRPAVSAEPNVASKAFAEALPNGKYSRYTPVVLRAKAFPASRVLGKVHSVLGGEAMPVTLSCDERLFSTIPWPGYISVDMSAANSTTQWLSRFAELRKLASVKDPGQFAKESTRTGFGPIDVFVLRRGEFSWQWLPFDYHGRLDFSPAQFSPAEFAVFDDLPGGYVLAVRLPALDGRPPAGAAGGMNARAAARQASGIAGRT